MDEYNAETDLLVSVTKAVGIEMILDFKIDTS